MAHDLLRENLRVVRFRNWLELNGSYILRARESILLVVVDLAVTIAGAVKGSKEASSSTLFASKSQIFVLSTFVRVEVGVVLGVQEELNEKVSCHAKKRIHLQSIGRTQFVWFSLYPHSQDL